MATSAAASIAAIAARARREVIEYLSGRNAFGPSRAVPLDFPSRLHERQLGVLIGLGVVHDTGAGRYWLDRAALELDEQRRRDAAKLVMTIVLIVFLLSVVATAILAAQN